MDIDAKVKPVLDPGFMPAVLWNRAYRARCEADPASEPLGIALSRPDGTVYSVSTNVLPHEGENIALNTTYVERMVKFLLWSKGGSRITIAGNPAIGAVIATVYSPNGKQTFDYDIMGRRMFLETLTVTSCPFEELPEANEKQMSLGRNLDGCRIGFDLGGSDRKAAAVIDGEVVFSEEIEWDPYFQADPQYHLDGIRDSLNRAATHLPRVDAIGGSAAGDYINNEPRIASLFRGLSEEDFDNYARPIFLRIKEEWGNIPFEVANDGEVTALAGSMSLNANAVLGIAMGTSQAVGYCDPDGLITSALNELAFAPIDYRPDAPADEWSGDIGCGVQYFSQQAVARLAPKSGIALPADMPFPEQLIAVQELMATDDPRARKIYETIGTYFGYALASYAEFYEIQHLLLLGRVTSGPGGQVIIDSAEELLRQEFPDLGEQIQISTPDEQLKRHGQAIAAASLPQIQESGIRSQESAE
ncbi:MAG: ROK family protein [Kiritimatiellae bacterium]|nr:ROK family protein [Kiritimatiellia bacterium]